MNVDDLLDRTGLPQTEVDTDAAFADVSRRVRRRRRRIWSGTAVAALVVLVAVAGLASFAPAGDERDVAAGSDPTTTSSDPFDPSTSVSEPSSAIENWQATPIGEGPWSGARSSADGRELLIAFAGAAPSSEQNPCWADYRAEASESADTISVTVYAGSSRSGTRTCTLEGYTRRVVVSLQEPLGERELVLQPSGETRPVFDGSTLATPGWLPEGWTLQRESGGHLAEEGQLTWFRTWGPERPQPADGACVGTSRTPINLQQGPPEILAALTPADATRRDEAVVRDIRRARYFESEDRARQLQWVEKGRGFVVSTNRGCSDDTMATRADLEHFAETLEIPS